MATGFSAFMSDVLGFEALRGLSRDAVLLLLMKALRMYAFGYVAVILVIYLEEMGYNDVDIGWLFTLTLIGDMLISLLLTTRADAWGRKATLLVGAGLSVMTSVVFSMVTSFWALVVAATVGVISPSGNEVGPFQGVEVSCLAQVTDDTHHTRLMAWYNLFGYVCLDVPPPLAPRLSNPPHSPHCASTSASAHPGSPVALERLRSPRAVVRLLLLLPPDGVGVASSGPVLLLEDVPSSGEAGGGDDDDGSGGGGGGSGLERAMLAAARRMLGAVGRVAAHRRMRVEGKVEEEVVPSGPRASLLRG